MDQGLGHGDVYTPVKVHGDIQGATNGLPQVRDTLDGVINLAVTVDDLHLFGEIHLGGLKPVTDGALGTAHDVSWPVTANPGIDTNAVAYLAAKQLMNRRVMKLTLDIPQGLVDARNGTHVDAAAAIKPAAV